MSRTKLHMSGIASPPIFCNVRTVLTASTTFVAPVSGWYRLVCVGGGGAGGGAVLSEEGRLWLEQLEAQIEALRAQLT